MLMVFWQMEIMLWRLFIACLHHQAHGVMQILKIEVYTYHGLLVLIWEAETQPTL